jgi:hypothetical protein
MRFWGALVAMLAAAVVVGAGSSEAAPNYERNGLLHPHFPTPAGGNPHEAGRRGPTRRRAPLSPT